jgi:hypothetical protein
MLKVSILLVCIQGYCGANDKPEAMEKAGSYGRCDFQRFFLTITEITIIILIVLLKVITLSTIVIRI